MDVRLRDKLAQDSGFLVFAELTGGPNFDLSPVQKFLQGVQKAGRATIPAGFDLAAVTFPQNPGGVPNIDPPLAYHRLVAEGLLQGLDFIPHVTCKDHNTAAITTSLAHYGNVGVESLLVMTGDKPVAAQGVFELDSTGVLQLVRKINHDNLLKAKPDALSRVHRFFPGAAVSPFKYTEPSQMQQYYKMEKKLACGARFLITQVGWDWRKSQELFRYLRDRNLHVPVFGNVFLLSTLTAAPRMMHDVKLTGCYVSDALLAKVYSESVEDHIERAAQQVAMYKALGAAGVDVGGVPDFATFQRIFQRAADIGPMWEQFKENLHWPAPDPFYMHDADGHPAPLASPDKTVHQRFFDFNHRHLLDPDHLGFHAFKKVLSVTGTDDPEGALYKLFNAAEKGFKYLSFECQECGDCYLPENFGLCTIGGCEKGMGNAPCGDATAMGQCGNNLDRVCIGERIYLAAAAKKGGRERLRDTINRPRNPALAHTSSIVNYLFGKDHTMKNALISIGEALHASIPKVGAVMRRLDDLGDGAYSKCSDALEYVRALIESQVDEGADYIAVNVDAFGEDDPQRAVRMMIEYVGLVRQWGRGVPACMDSSNDDCLIAGLKTWYGTGQRVRTPLINSVKAYTVDKVLPLHRDYNFNFIGLLVSEGAPQGPGGSYSVDQLLDLANVIFDAAVGRYGFKSEQIFFDSTVFPLAIDMPMDPDVPGYTYRAFETIRRIRQNPKFKGVHCSLGISNSVRDLPGRKIGICRAYVAKAMEYGLDAGIVNTAHKYGTVEPSPELLEMVDAYAKMDGSAERLNEAIEIMGRFCRENRKPSV